MLTDDDKLEAFVRKAAVGVWHASCTCRMGADSDPMAVTDPAGRVRGVDGLRVVDASVFPVVPCANTNFPVLMTAEKMADAILTACGCEPGRSDRGLQCGGSLVEPAGRWCGRIAQLVEQLTLNQRAQGSSPCAPTNDFSVLRLISIPRIV